MSQAEFEIKFPSQKLIWWLKITNELGMIIFDILPLGIWYHNRVCYQQASELERQLQRNCFVLLPGDESNVLFSIIITKNLGLTHVGSHHNTDLISFFWCCCLGFSIWIGFGQKELSNQGRRLEGPLYRFVHINRSCMSLWFAVHNWGHSKL